MNDIGNIVEGGSISEIIKQVAKQHDVKKAIRNISVVRKKEIDMLERILIHAESEEFPNSLFAKKAPNESSEQFGYRKEVYKPITHRPWTRHEEKLARVLNTDNYSVDWPEIEAAQWKEDQPAKYFTQDYPGHGSVFDYAQQIVIHEKVVDANAVDAIRPKRVPGEWVEGESGELIFVPNQSEAIEPISIIYRSDSVVAFNEHSLIAIAGIRKLKGGQLPIFHVYTTETTSTYTPIGKASDHNYIESEIWEHGLGVVPAKRLEGRPLNYKGSHLWKSAMYEAVNELDNALYNYSTLQLSTVAHAFPHMWQISPECNATGCVGGKVADEETGDFKNCPSCKGTGMRPRGALTVHEVAIPDDADAPQIPTPPLGYVEMNTAVLEFLERRVEKEIEDAFKYGSDNQAQGDETATGRQIDREDLWSALYSFSQELFDHISWQIDIIGQMRYGDLWESPTIDRPTQYKFKDTLDLLEEERLVSDAPEIVRIVKRRAYISRQFANDPIELRKALLQLEIDRLAVWNDEQIRAQQNRTITKREVILHQSFFFILNELIRDKEVKIEKEKVTDIKIISDKMIERAQQIADGVAERRINVDFE